jgi:hypothetical protein
MPILRIVNRGLDRETYEALCAILEVDWGHPLGLIVHGASEVGGTMRVVQVWGSEEYARRFDEEQLKLALQAVGAPLHAEVAVFELHHLVTH